MNSNLHERTRTVVQRHRGFVAAAGPGHYLVVTHVPAEAPPVPPLSSFDLDRELGRWLDCQLAAARPAWRARQDVDDDALPCICPRFGIAEHSAWLGMEVRLQEDTSLPVPLVRSPEDLGRIRLSDRTRWFRHMREGYQHLRRRQDGSFLLSVRGTMTPMDLGNAVRGDELFADFLAEPEFAHRLMRRMVEAIRWYYPQLVSWADPVEGGNVFAFGGWLGPGCMGHTSNDAAMLCSPEVYAEFGFPYERETFAGYRQVLYHVHNEKLHFVPELCRHPNLALLEVTRDPKTPPAIEDLPRICAATASASLSLVATSDQIRAHIGELAGRNVFLEARCADRGDARDVIALVRSRSKPLE